MATKLTFMITLFISFTTLAADLDTAWQCDIGYKEILWCDLVSGDHDFSRMSYCQKPDPKKADNLITQLIIVRENGEDDYTREVAPFDEVKEENFEGQKRLVFYFDGAMKITSATDTEWSGKYVEYRLTLSTAKDPATSTHRLYGTNHQVTRKQKADKTWSNIDVGAAFGSQNAPNIMKCYRPE